MRGVCARRSIVTGELPTRLPAQQDDSTLWFVTVTLSGDPVDPREVREALERLSVERPFVVSARYGSRRAEVRYWDECDDAAGAAAQALRMWADHETSARLPAWRVVGLEVYDRDSARLHVDRPDHPRVQVLGEIKPFDAPS